MPVEITTPNELDEVRNGLSGNYEVMNPIDLSDFENWDPIGRTSDSTLNNFTGTFDGAHFPITGLNINRPTAAFVGLFAQVTGTLKRVLVLEATVVGCIGAAILCGNVNGENSIIEDCGVSGTLTGGGNSSPSVGHDQGTGGIYGWAYNQTIIRRCYSHTNVIRAASDGHGVLGGWLNYSSMSKAKLFDCYSRGSVQTSNDSHGGLTTGGWNNTSIGEVRRCLAISEIIKDSGTKNGFINVANSDNNIVSDNYWDTDVSETTTAQAAATGKTTAQLQDIDTFSGWDIVPEAEFDPDDPSVWFMPASGYPKLWFEYEGTPTPPFVPSRIPWPQQQPTFHDDNT